MRRRPPTAERLPVAVLAGCAVAYFVAVVIASGSPGPRAWGLHLPGFLPSAPRFLTLGLMAAGALLLASAALGSGLAARSAPRRESEGSRWAWLALLPAYGIVLYVFRARTYFLGDGLVWLNALQGGEQRAFSEPLSAAAWHGFAAAARSLRMPPVPSTFAILPVLCGVAAAAIAWGIARELFADRGARAIGWALLLTAGFTQLYFGYIESYPVASVAILGYLWLGLRRLRGTDPPWILGAALSVAVACHLTALYLLPSYLLVVALDRPHTGRKLAAALLPVALAPALLLVAGTRPSDWLVPFQTAAQGFLLGRAAGHVARPYSALSIGHGWDVANALLLAVPVSVFLLAGWVVSRRGRILPSTPAGRFLAAAALPGTLVTLGITLPVAPAQDWDLTAILLLPIGAAGLAAARPLLAPGSLSGVKAGLVALSSGALLAFVLVNANEAAGIARFEKLLSEGSRISPYGRGYGYSMLAEFYEDRGDFASALRFARAALEAEKTNPRYWVKVGTALYNQGLFGEATPVLEEAVRRGPDRADGLHNLGLCYARTARLPEAIVRFRAAVARDPDLPEYRHNLGLSLFMTGESDSARLVWSELLRRWPGYTATRRSYERRFGPAPPTR